jgi:hypothetical protein
MIRSNPLVLNFDEYLIKVRAILKSSEVFYHHTLITSENCITLIDEIRKDKNAFEVC